MGVLDKLRRFRFRSLDRGDYATEEGRPVENVDALAALGGRGFDPSQAGQHSIPPNYIKQDDGRPPH